MEGANDVRHVGKLFAQAGKRAEFVAILLRAAQTVGQLPGCRLYAVNEDLADETCIWVMEIWQDKQPTTNRSRRARAGVDRGGQAADGRRPEGSELKLVGGHGVSFQQEILSEAP